MRRETKKPSKDVLLSVVITASHISQSLAALHFPAREKCLGKFLYFCRGLNNKGSVTGVWIFAGAVCVSHGIGHSVPLEKLIYTELSGSRCSALEPGPLSIKWHSSK